MDDLGVPNVRKHTYIMFHSAAETVSANMHSCRRKQWRHGGQLMSRSPNWDVPIESEVNIRLSSFQSTGG